MARLPGSLPHVAAAALRRPSVLCRAAETLDRLMGTLPVVDHNLYHSLSLCALAATAAIADAGLTKDDIDLIVDGNVKASYTKTLSMSKPTVLFFPRATRGICGQVRLSGKGACVGYFVEYYDEGVDYNG